MARQDFARTVENYLAYLEHIRLPETIPATQEDAKTMLKELDRRSADNPYADAWEPVEDLIHSDPETAWQVLLESVAQCQECDLGMIGAGVLETFMWYRGVEFLERILAEIRTNTNLRRAFGSVYLGADFPESEGRLINATLVSCGLPVEDTIDWWRTGNDT